jgi:hypothetical protein
LGTLKFGGLEIPMSRKAETLSRKIENRLTAIKKPWRNTILEVVNMIPGQIRYVAE